MEGTMSFFNGKPTKEYLSAVAALKKLDWDRKTRAFADASRPDLERQITSHAGKPEKKKSWRLLLAQKLKDDDRLPRDDHVDLRLEKDRIYTSHPYFIGMEELRQIVKACDENGL